MEEGQEAEAVVVEEGGKCTKGVEEEGDEEVGEGGCDEGKD